jgi:hypothetical protein
MPVKRAVHPGGSTAFWQTEVIADAKAGETLRTRS